MDRLLDVIVDVIGSETANRNLSRLLPERIYTGLRQQIGPAMTTVWLGGFLAAFRYPARLQAAVLNSPGDIRREASRIRLLVKLT